MSPALEQPVKFFAVVEPVSMLPITLVLMWLAEPLMQVIGVTGVNVAGRIFGVVPGALTVQFVVDGLRTTFLH